MSHDISLSQVGPIDKLSFQLTGFGVTVLVGPNGVGKSQALSALQKAMQGKGKLPLRDGQRRGSVEVGGVLISIGQTTRYNGEFQIKNLESSLPLSTLVDPGLINADAADRQRIKALVALTGVVASRELFASNPALKDFESVVDDEALKTDDLVEAASRVKRCYEAKAREAEKDADREEGHVRGLEEAASGISLEAESNAEQLQAEYDAARDTHTELVTRIANHEERVASAKRCKIELETLRQDYSGKTFEAASAERESLSDKLTDQDTEIEATEHEMELLELKLEAQQNKRKELLAQADTARVERQRAAEHDAAVKALETSIETYAAGGETGNFADPAETYVAVETAAAAQELGVKIRDAKTKLDQAEAHKAAAAAARKRAEHLRSAAGSVDEVLSDAIKSDVLKVDIQDGAARLVVNHPQRGEKTPYHELSMGERWSIAIGLGADRVGEGGLLVVEQDAWESLDAFVRPLIHEHAVKRKVFVLTAEATRDPEDGTGMQAKSFAEAGA